MTDTPAPYGYCSICGGLGLSLERRPNGDARCENGHFYRPVGPSVTTLKLGPEAAELEQLKRELQRMTIKKDGLMDRLTQIERANVDRWSDGYAAAERRIVAWLRAGQGIAWEPASLQISDAIERGEHRAKERE